jgi:hypothetical protein
LEFVLSEPLSVHLSSALALESVLSEPLSVHLCKQWSAQNH